MRREEKIVQKSIHTIAHKYTYMCEKNTDQWCKMNSPTTVEKSCMAENYNIFPIAYFC